MLKLKIRGIAAAILAGALLAGCSGGGSKSVLPSTPSQSGTVQTTMTVVIGGAGTQTAKRNGETIPVANSKSLVFRYVGDTNYTAAPTNPLGFPGTAPAASIGGNAFWNITGCTVIGPSETCVVPGVTLPIGTIDLYVLDYDAVGGTGNLIYASVTTVTVTSAGAITNPGTGAPQALNALNGNTAATGSTIALNNAPASPIVPAFGAGPLFQGQTAAATPINLPNGNPGFNISAKDANGLAITGPINSVTVTDNDLTGNTCLLVVAGGGSAGTKTCTPVVGTASSVTVTNTADSIYLQYNNAPMPLAGLKITAAATSGSVPASVSKTLAFQPTGYVGFDLSAAPSSTFSGGVLAAIGSTVFVNTLHGTTATAQVRALTFNKGALTLGATQLPATTLGNGTGATAVQQFTVGPDGNLWWLNDYAGATVAYIGVYAVTAATGGAGSVAKGTVAETKDLYTAAPLLSGGANLNGITTFGGYIWAVDSTNDIIRVDPTAMTAGTTNGIIVVKPNTNNNPAALPSGGVYNGGLTSVAGVGLFATTTKGTIVKIANPSTAAGATAATLIAAASVTESTPANGSAATGIIVGSDNNLWTANSTGAAGPFIFATQALAPSAIVPLATAVTWGSVAQGGPDNLIYTTSGTAANAGALAFVSTGGATINGLMIDGTGTNGCSYVTSGVNLGGQQLISLGGYIIGATNNAGISATNVCVYVP